MFNRNVRNAGPLGAYMSKIWPQLGNFENAFVVSAKGGANGASYSFANAVSERRRYSKTQMTES